MSKRKIVFSSLIVVLVLLALACLARIFVRPPPRHKVGDVPVGPFSHWVLTNAPPAPFPVPPPVDRALAFPAWWEKPAPLTEKEIEYQRYLSSISWKLPQERWSEVWGQFGDQLGLHSIRFFAGYAGYAAYAIGSRTPAYPALTGRILRSVFDTLLDRRTWEYVSRLWKNEPWYPDPAANENVMYTGHLMQIAAMYEAATGDPRYRTEGFDFVWDATTRFHYTLMSVVDVTLRQMRENPSGGVTCEPGYIFVACNNHVHVALRMLEGMGQGDYKAERDKWERFVLAGFYDEVGGGAFRIVYSHRKAAFYPLGYPGMDGWILEWYPTWTKDPETSRSLWTLARSRIRWDLFGERSGWDRIALHGNAGLASLMYDNLQKIVHPVPSAAFLYAAAAVNGDAATATRLRGLLEARCLKREGGSAFMGCGKAYEINATSNAALGATVEAGTDLRAVIRRPLPRDYFAGPLVDDVLPEGAAVYQAFRDGGDLVVELDSPGPAEIRLRNVPQIREITGLPRPQWTYDGQVLRISAQGRLTLRISIGS
jgi:hypothetical protein